MMTAADCLENMIYEDEELKKELKEESTKTKFVDKIEAIIMVKKFKKLLKNKNSKVYSYLDNNKEILNGKTVIKGTRITPETITNYVYFLMSGNNNNNKITSPSKVVEKVLTEYPSLTEEDIKAAMIYDVANTSYISILFSK